MISLKNYINEGILGDIELTMANDNKFIISNIKAWAKTNITKQRGRMKSYKDDNGYYVLEYTGVDYLGINFLNIPGGVKIKANNPQRTYLYNITDGFMNVFIDSEFNELFIKSGNAKFTGDIQSCKINKLYLDLDECSILFDFSPFKSCNIHDLHVSCHTHNKRSIDFNGIYISNSLTYYGDYAYTGKNAHELIVTGKYNANNIKIQFLKIHGLPQKISGCLFDSEGLSWWDNDIKSVGERLMFSIHDDLFKEIYDIITSKNFKLPKLNNASFDTSGWGYKFNNPKDMLIALQAGYMRKVVKYCDAGEMRAGFNSYELEFKTDEAGEHFLKQWLDDTGYKLINDYDLNPTSFDKMLHTQRSEMFHVFDKKDKIIATYHPRSGNIAASIISTDINIINTIRNIK